MHLLRRVAKLLNLKSAFLNLKSLWGQLKARSSGLDSLLANVTEMRQLVSVRFAPERMEQQRRL